MEKENALRIMKALADETRLRIFLMLKDKPLCGYQILDKFDIKEPTLSHHLKVLLEAGLITSEKDWKWIYYSRNAEKFDEFIMWLKTR